MAQMIEFICKNFSMIALTTSLLIAVLVIVVTRTKGADAWTILLRWTALLPAGITGLYTFVMHTWFQEMSAQSIGWKPSPFEYEVAIANLAVGVLGILSFFRCANYSFRLAFVIAATIWLGGDAVGHVYQMITHHNFSAGNAGPWFWTDILVPLILLLCVIVTRPRDTSAATDGAPT